MTGGRTTGEPQVDATLARLAEVAALPLEEQPAVFEDVHRQLREALTGGDEASPDSPG
jgi:hypothetical protein